MKFSLESNCNSTGADRASAGRLAPYSRLLLPTYAYIPIVDGAHEMGMWKG